MSRHTEQFASQYIAISQPRPRYITRFAAAPGVIMARLLERLHEWVAGDLFASLVYAISR